MGLSCVGRAVRWVCGARPARHDVGPPAGGQAPAEDSAQQLLWRPQGLAAPLLQEVAVDALEADRREELAQPEGDVDCDP